MSSNIALNQDTAISLSITMELVKFTTKQNTFVIPNPTAIMQQIPLIKGPLV